MARALRGTIEEDCRGAAGVDDDILVRGAGHNRLAFLWDFKLLVPSVYGLISVNTRTLRYSMPAPNGML